MTHERERLTLRPAERVPETASVRHVDQLTEESLDALVGMADGESARVSGMDPGEVVVFTSYFEVVPAERERGCGTERGEATERRVDVGPVG